MEKLIIKNVKKVEKLKYLKSYVVEYLDGDGNLKEWELASRGDLDRLLDEINNNKSFSDGIMIFASNKDKNKVVLLKEYRVSAGKYVYTIPAGLVDDGEKISQTSKREFKEETGMEFELVDYSKERFTSVGLTNEKVNVAFGYYSGIPSKEYQEATEDAEIIIADKEFVERILKEDEVTVRTAHLLEYFFRLNDFFEN